MSWGAPDLALNLLSLTDVVRRFMVSEIDSDVQNRRLYLSHRLSSQGQQDYPTLLRDAATAYHDNWLAGELGRHGRLNQTEQRRKPSGGYTTVRVPNNAAEMLAEGEFNRFYVHGLCLSAAQQGVSTLVVYRAKLVVNPRPESVAKIGSAVNAATLLADLRNDPGLEPALGVPPGPNSGLSVKLP